MVSASVYLCFRKLNKKKEKQEAGRNFIYFNFFRVLSKRREEKTKTFVKKARASL